LRGLPRRRLFAGLYPGRLASLHLGADPGRLTPTRRSTGPHTADDMGNTYDTEIARIEADHIQTKWRTTEDYRWGYTGDRGNFLSSSTTMIRFWG